MSCAVYCLVPHPEEQLDRLVGRLQDAGVATDDIMVVRRQGQAAHEDADARIPTAYFIPGLWGMPAAWWWPLVLPERGGPQAAEAPATPARATEHEVISLASYRAKRAAGAL